MCSIFRVPRVHDAAIINVPGVFVVSDNTPGYFMSPRRGYDEKNYFRIPQTVGSHPRR